MRQLQKIISLILVFTVLTVNSQAQHRVRLWKDTGVRALGVTLEEFVPSEGKGRMAVIVCPGGSYCWHDYRIEGTEVAKWLNRNGIAAFVLKYRVQGKFEYATHSRAIFGGHQHPDMITDAQRAIQYVREHAKEYGIDPNRIGVMGFSAGGHLAMSAASYNETDFLARRGVSTGVSLRPDFVAPIYPVVSMSHRVTHKRSRRALLGEYKKFRHSLRDSLSLERHVPDNCPPVFLVNCKDDPIVKYQNSELLDSALCSKNVTHRYIQYETGGHGFGASETKGTSECREWKNEFLKWIKEQNL